MVTVEIAQPHPRKLLVRAMVDGIPYRGVLLSLFGRWKCWAETRLRAVLCASYGAIASPAPRLRGSSYPHSPRPELFHRAGLCAPAPFWSSVEQHCRHTHISWTRRAPVSFTATWIPKRVPGRPLFTLARVWRSMRSMGRTPATARTTEGRGGRSSLIILLVGHI